MRREKHEVNQPHFERQTTKKGTGGGGTTTKSYHKCTSTSYTHCHNHLSHTFLLISSATLSSNWFSHTMHPKTHSLPFPATETSNDEKRGMEVFFSSQKESNHRIVWIYVLEDAKDLQQQVFLNKRSFHIGTKKNNEVCFRTDKKLY